MVKGVNVREKTVLRNELREVRPALSERTKQAVTAFEKKRQNQQDNDANDC